MNFDMAPYGQYIWPAYAISAVALVGVTLWCWLSWRAAKARLKALETDEASGLCPAGHRLCGAGDRAVLQPVASPVRPVPSALLDKPAPSLVLPALDAQSAAFTPADLKAGHVSVINVFASWCAPCRTEVGQLAALSKVPGIALYGITQKDKPDASRAFLDEVGNPFAKIARDDDGRASIEWGVYGVPETFVVDGKGIVRFKYVGPLTDDVLAQQVMPAIKASQGG